ncbi:LacI family DNA-binding transcriptional regulator [Microbacterium sp. No. 7]|uniref:LacI family DNA-binding transcriptional regulator n=1 Tax=Microbacterium sp. No. 7 TaxID=1714373 RepID=UPI0006CF2FD2|nr:LacI family DNA-binding transcriptional regulator [Microbacterium sp. No. 7]ALJ21295.1 transcriptional regulator [Microbacterium sp. No. 7]
MVGIADVAARAGVSKATASRALSGGGSVAAATRERVRRVAEELGYAPSTSAVSLATGRTQNIGVIMPYLTRWFFAEVLEGVQTALLDRGLDLTLYDARPGSAARARIFRDFLTRKRFDGLIAVGLEPDVAEIRQLAKVGRPVVGVVTPAGETSCVTVDDDYALRRATEHLLTLGHRTITFLGGGVDEQGREQWTHVDRRRFEGYAAAMTDAGLSGEIRHIRSPTSMPGGYAAAVDLFGDARQRPTGVVATCDEVAVGAIIAARRLGIQVPLGLSVIGVDDHELAEMFSLTTLQQDPREQGAAAVALLLAHIEDPARTPTVVRMQSRLVVRGTTGPADPARAPAVLDSDRTEKQ